MQMAALRGATRTGLARRPDHLVHIALAMRAWHRTPAACLHAAAAAYPDRAALVDDAGPQTFAQLDAATDALANALSLGAGEKVAVMCRNHRGFAHAVLAASKLGAHVLLLNTDFAAPQLTELLDREQPALVIHDEEFAQLLAGASAPRMGERELAHAARGPHAAPPPRPAAPGRITILSSGTTGTPKGVNRPGSTPLGPLLALLDRMPLRARKTQVLAAPMFHGWGFLHFALGLLLGTTTVLARRFDPERTLALIAQHRASAAPMVPLMLLRIMELDPQIRRAHDTSSLRAIPLAGSAIPGGLPERALGAFGDVVYNIYGSTECALATVATPQDLRAAPTTAGRPLGGTRVAVLDAAGRPLPPNRTGVIHIGSQLRSDGYSGGGAKRDVGGLLSSGDLGHFDDAGRLFIDGREDEMIVSGGENVYPGEVEDLLARHPAIADVAVTGAADPEFGQRLAAYVVLRSGERLTDADVRQHVRAHLARYKVPRDVSFLEELPRNPAGKVLKRELA
jgi:fatty-acyl-CoA synthase